MTPEQLALLDRIESFDIDGGDAALPFAARLAREHGWTRRYAGRVVREYKRFVFLAASGTEPVCPSEAVDAAWHLHLTYTRSYWKRFCGEVLGRPLHHEPTRGGPAEARKHLRMYADTLGRYRDIFGEDPPADIWPPAPVRFGEDLSHRVVNTARNWVVPKSPVRTVARLTAAFVALAVFVPGCAGGGMNPFNLVGKQFLGFLIPVMIAAVCIGRIIRSSLRTPDSQPGDDELSLSWEQTAYLAGGYPRLTTAAIARLVENGSAVLSDDRNLLDRGARLPDEGLRPVEMSVYKSLPFKNTPSELKSVQTAVETVFGEGARHLESEGFLLNPGRQVGMGCAAVIPIALVILFLAVPRLVMGVANGKPIDYLVFTMLFGGLVGAIASAAGPARLSRRGENMLARLRARHGGLRAGGGSDAALAVALFGTVALAGTSLAYMQTWYPRQTTDSSSGGCGTSSDGGGDGGGGCGGGCGGCGGD